MVNGFKYKAFFYIKPNEIKVWGSLLITGKLYSVDIKTM